eukprot:Pgem_evm1s16087
MPCPIKTVYQSSSEHETKTIETNNSSTSTSKIQQIINRFNKFKTTKAYNVLYYMMMFMLLLLHIELFTGGKICRMLFVKNNESDINAVPQPITAVPNPFRI